MASTNQPLIFHGGVIHSRSETELEILQDATLAVDVNGHIVSFKSADDGTAIDLPDARHFYLGQVGLGTDSGGGWASQMLAVMRQAIIASNAQEKFSDGADKSLLLEEVFYLATMGGARVLGLEERIGNFEVGKEFDTLWVTTTTGLDSAILFEKFIMTSDDRNIPQCHYCFQGFVMVRRNTRTSEQASCCCKLLSYIKDLSITLTNIGQTHRQPSSYLAKTFSKAFTYSLS
ncbi:metal-dependent hydrolase [Stachybotrys elegans]|uniref:Metal-dependent hydrolase n=1 Tax=Stachybotrys elegans TaxID=80388 RepID=A0A8K0WLG3_9HYPO|nr:metal-dependent hydrolase [Stachybotrys elegans]